MQDPFLTIKKLCIWQEGRISLLFQRPCQKLMHCWWIRGICAVYNFLDDNFMLHNLLEI